MSAGKKRSRYRKADEAARKRLADMLGLVEYRNVGLEIDEAELAGDDVRVHVTWKRVGDGWIRIARGRDGPHFCASTHVSFNLEGRDVDRAFGFVMRKAARALAGKDLDAVIAAITPLDAEDDDTTPDVPTPIHNWAIPGAWRQFLCDHAVQRKFYETFSFEGPSMTLMHGDMECGFITPRVGFRLPRFFNYPWPLASQDEIGIGGATTDLDDMDVIQGGQDKLEQGLGRAIETMRDKGPILVNSTCVPIMIGDDVESVIARLGPRSPKGIYHVGPRTLQPVDVFMEYVEDEKRRLMKDRGVVPGSVALVGFRDTPAVDELARLLALAGITVTGRVLPVMSNTRLAQALRAEVLVFNPSDYHTPLYERVFGDVDAKEIYPPGPWGIELAEQWAMAVADAVGARDAMQGTLEGWHSGNESRLASMRDRAQEIELGFVIEPGAEKRLVDPGSITGLPIVPVVHELGFEVRILVYAGDPAEYGVAVERLRTGLGDRDRIRIHGFTDQDELEGFLSAPSLRAVYSEFFYDHRLSRRGKGQFSAAHFEMGLEGAMRSLDRLLWVANHPFYRNYRRSLRTDSTTWWWT